MQSSQPQKYVSKYLLQAHFFRDGRGVQNFERFGFLSNLECLYRVLLVKVCTVWSHCLIDISCIAIILLVYSHVDPLSKINDDPLPLYRR